MKGYVSTRVPEDLDAGKPTFENLCKHVDRYGLDTQHKGNNVGKPVRYSTYKQFRNDSAVEVARAYLTQDAYAMFVERYGAHAWADDARADWDKVREAAE